ncbi:D-2-hydroxyglutarate dehydrogenase, mitochondrial [Frankliniella fusca]|uniref:D-2-hydroxyglutarate dehydrogenase, mitochondrial n=1 Tax=Frankliniella fusca TaxID=407009 RepID=A0AAE1HEA5_9NEOP|nr:D-2-hydroxyglutarate dehydrogenase, mitochondrial [Frankliniella fusca]
MEKGRKIVNGANAALPDFTTERFPHLKRGDFAVLDDRHLGFFEDLLGKENVVTDPVKVAAHNIDWDRQARGRGNVVLKPTSTQQVADVLAYCNAERLAVTPQGGNTGLVWGSVPVFDEIILSTERLNEILSFDEVSGVLTCQAGCILGDIDAYVRKRGFIVPLDLGAKGKCHIGGNLSTNAGGVRLVRYGSLHGSVLGVEVVRADGTVLRLMNTLRKDNSGFHLKHMFIGSEGTLGVITQVAIQCSIAPAAEHVLFLGVPSFGRVVDAFRAAREALGETLSACEMMDGECMRVVVDKLGYRNPLQDDYPFYVLVEASGSDAQHDREKIAKLLNAVRSSGVASDGVLASSEAEMRSLWETRLRVGKGLWADGCLYTFDISVPLRMYYDIVPEMTQRLREAGRTVTRVCGFGHMGDSNLHLAVTTPSFDTELLEWMEEFVYEWTSKRSGSVAAEHGVGFKKNRFLHLSKTAPSVSLMKDLKDLMDPKGILNPYKVLPLGLTGKSC